MKTGSDVTRGKGAFYRKTIDRNDSSDTEEILNVDLHSYDGPEIQLRAFYAAKRAGTGQD